MIAVGLVRAYLARGSYHGLYYSIEKPLKFFQTGALLEVRLGGLCVIKNDSRDKSAAQLDCDRKHSENVHVQSRIVMICCTLLSSRMAFGNVE